MTPQALADALEGFLSTSSSAIIVEEGAVVFDRAQSKYSISGETNKGLLHLWSSERNVVRRVLDIETRGETLRITVRRMRMAKPTKLEICRHRDPRTASAKKPPNPEASAVNRKLFLGLAPRNEFSTAVISHISNG